MGVTANNTEVTGSNSVLYADLFTVFLDKLMYTSP